MNRYSICLKNEKEILILSNILTFYKYTWNSGHRPIDWRPIDFKKSSDDSKLFYTIIPRVKNLAWNYNGHIPEGPSDCIYFYNLKDFLKEAKGILNESSS